jgi:GR25 family glycosyltransferase involved in LPS biosynthesis
VWNIIKQRGLKRALVLEDDVAFRFPGTSDELRPILKVPCYTGAY